MIHYYLAVVGYMGSWRAKRKNDTPRKGKQKQARGPRRRARYIYREKVEVFKFFDGRGGKKRKMREK